ncbi:hypothetical protein IW262DRAFT_1297080 [Armillaria fumosa]|nr:hypothetical protein IW262DRAFT_1297080 [Armillaria fumosa]
MITPQPSIERNNLSDVDVLVCLIETVSLSDSQANDLVRAVLQSTIPGLSVLSMVHPVGTLSPTPQLLVAHPVAPVEPSTRTLLLPVSGPPVVVRVMPLEPTFGYHVPLEGEDGPFYIVTHGTDVGVFSGWENTSPLVDSILGCSYHAVATCEEGIERVESTLERHKCALLPPPNNVGRRGRRGLGIHP